MQTFFVSAYRSSGEVVYISYPMVRLVILLAAIVIDVARWLALNRTKIGMFVRAGVDDCEMLAASGVRVQRIFVVVFAFRAGLAGLAGVVGGTFQSLAPGEDVRLLLASPRSGAERAVHAGGWCGAGRGGGLRIDPSRTALMLQDLQNDVVIGGGALADNGAPAHAWSQNVIEHCRRLPARRDPGDPCLVRLRARPPADAAERAALRGRGRLQGAGTRHLGRRAGGAARPEPGDVVVEKMTMSAWESSRLETYLRGAGINTLINCGVWTNMSVEHTIRTGADTGIRVIVPEDCCATMNAAWHAASIDNALQNGATGTRSERVLAALPSR